MMKRSRTSGGRFSRFLEILLSLAALLWTAAATSGAARAAAGFAGRLRLTYGQGLLESLFLLFLAGLGYRAIEIVVTRGEPRPEVFNLPQRKTAAREWGSGFAVGWGVCLATVLPALLVGRFHAALNRGSGVLPGIAETVLTLAAAALTQEVVFRGYPFRRLVQGLGPAWATVTMSAIFAVAVVSDSPVRGAGWALANTFLFGVLLAICYLRTNGLWVGWGLHFGYRAVMAAVLGLPIGGRSNFGSLMNARASGPQWLSGGAFGLDAAAWTAIAMLVGMAIVYRATRDWAWAYTLPEIVSGGYAVEVAPPPAHAAMEKAAAPPPLVQILSATPQSFSVRDESGPTQ